MCCTIFGLATHQVPLVSGEYDAMLCLFYWLLSAAQLRKSALIFLARMLLQCLYEVRSLSPVQRPVSR